MKYDLYLRGYVGSADFDADLVSRTLTKYKDQPVTVLIDSLGGSLATALSIASAFRNHGDVTVHFVGMNASAATIASMGAAHIEMDEYAMYLVHKCSTEFCQWASMNADQLQSQIDQLAQMKSDLEKMDFNVAKMYAEKCSKSTEELLALMKTGGWLTAEEAHAWGFVDRLTDHTEDAAPVLTEEVAASMQANGMPLPALPIHTPNAFAKLVDMLSSFFQRKDAANHTTKDAANHTTQDAPEEASTPKDNPTNDKKTTTMNKTLPAIAAVLALQQQEFTLTDERLTLTAEQVEAIEAHLNQQQEQLAAAKEANQEKQSQIDALLKQLTMQPAAETDQVINATRREDPLTVEAEFARNRANAQALFDALP